MKSGYYIRITVQVQFPVYVSPKTQSIGDCYNNPLIYWDPSGHAYDPLPTSGPGMTQSQSNINSAYNAMIGGYISYNEYASNVKLNGGTPVADPRAGSSSSNTGSNTGGGGGGGSSSSSSSGGGLRGVDFGPNEGADWLRTGSGLSFEEFWGVTPYGMAYYTGFTGSGNQSDPKNSGLWYQGTFTKSSDLIIDSTSVGNLGIYTYSNGELKSIPGIMLASTDIPKGILASAYMSPGISSNSLAITLWDKAYIEDKDLQTLRSNVKIWDNPLSTQGQKNAAAASTRAIRESYIQDLNSKGYDFRLLSNGYVEERIIKTIPAQGGDGSFSVEVSINYTITWQVSEKMATLTNVSGKVTSMKDGFRCINTEIYIAKFGSDFNNYVQKEHEEYNIKGLSFSYDVNWGSIVDTEDETTALLGANVTFQFQRGGAPVEKINIINLINSDNNDQTPSATDVFDDVLNHIVDVLKRPRGR